MRNGDNERPERETGHAGCAQESCDHARRPSPKEMLLGRAAQFREEAEKLELLAHALPGIMPAPAADALCDILEATL